REKVLSYIGWVLISIWSRTIRIQFIEKKIPDQLRAEGNNLIYAFWHGRQFLLFHNHRNTGIVIPASESRDGDIQAGVLLHFGFDVVRGSSKRKGDRALLGLVDGLRKGKDIALAVDGPRGPIYEVKQGITYLAGKLNKPIVPVATSAKRFWILEKIWDKYMLPVPFTRGVIVYGEPIVVRGIQEEELESKRRELTDALNRVMSRADAYFHRQAS
ncbi:MAG TPA: lysophospholipid acyltransferase family protein, partial [Nitrospirota bacterium]|nr:lysophospholipid acyltransferase family protein [Nitrospirota bacterium]